MKSTRSWKKNKLKLIKKSTSLSIKIDSAEVKLSGRKLKKFVIDLLLYYLWKMKLPKEKKSKTKKISIRIYRKRRKSKK